MGTDWDYIPQNTTEEMLPAFLEVLIDIRDNLETPYEASNSRSTQSRPDREAEQKVRGNEDQ